MRVCPTCNSKIQNPEAHFCFTCGTRLFIDTIASTSHLSDKSAPLESIKQEAKLPSSDFSSLPIVEPIKKPVVADRLSKKWNYFVISSNFLAILFLLISLGVFFRFNSESVQNGFSPTVEINNVEISDDLQLDTTAEVLKSEYSTVVPLELIVYYEASNINSFLPALLDDNQTKYIEDSYELDLNDLVVFLKPDFAYFKVNEESWALVTRTGGVDFFDRTYKLYEEDRKDSAPVITFRVKDFLVFTNEAALKDIIEETAEGNNLSLAGSPLFMSSVNKIQEDPFFYIYTNSQDYIDKNLEGDLNYFGLSALYTKLNAVNFKSLALSKFASGAKIQLLN